MSKVAAHWDHDIVDRLVAMVKERGSKTLLIGNGDVVDVKDGREKVREFGLDGIMIGTYPLFTHKINSVCPQK